MSKDINSNLIIAHHFNVDFCPLQSLQRHLTIEHNHSKTRIDVYQQQNYAYDDPVLHNTQYSFFFWHDHLFLDNLSISQQQIMKQARDFGIRSGLTFNCISHDQHFRCFSLSDNQDPDRFKLKMQKQFSNIFSFDYVLHKNLQAQLAVTRITFNKVSHINRAYEAH